MKPDLAAYDFLIGTDRYICIRFALLLCIHWSLYYTNGRCDFQKF